MFGMEKQKKQPEFFEFDLEHDLKSDQKMAKEIEQKVSTRIAELKNKLREGSKSKDFDQLGILLHGYTALEKVVKRICKQ